MELNTQIWGDSTEWQEDTIISYNNENAPKAYHGKYLNLGDYRNNGVFEFNTPIDNSIAYCGHAPNVSPYGDRAVYFWEAGDTPTITPRWRCQDKCDIALFDVSNGTADYNLDLLYGVRGFVEQNGEWLTETGFTRWLDYGNINPRYPDDYKQENLVVQPVVEFDPRIMFGVIMVSYYNENNELRTTTLHELESNPYHNNCQIVSAELSPAIVKDWYNNDNYGRYNTIIYDENKTFNMLTLTPINIDNGKILTYNTRMYRNAKFPLVGCTSVIGEYSKIAIEHATGDYPVKVSWNNYHYNNNDKEWGDEMSAGLILYGNSLLNVGNATAEHRTDYDINSIYYNCPATTETCEKIRRLAACYGLFFTDNPTNLYNNPDRWTNSDMMLGLLVDGVGYGDYTRGSDNTTNPAYNWNSSHDSGYDPAKNIDPNTYSDTTVFNTVSYQNTMTKRYLLNSADVGRLADELWSAQADKPAGIDFTDYVLDEYLTNNPIDTIVSLKYFPCKFPDQNVAVVYLGKYQTNIAAAALSTSVKVIDFDPIMVYPHYGDYRDFEPYTTLQIYIPFCGVIAIPTAEAMGRYVAVKLCIDVSTGACAGYVIVSQSGTGGICVATATGTAAIDIPVSGLQSANLAQAIFDATSNWTQTQVSTGRVTGGIFAQSDSVLGTIARGFATSGISAGSIVGGLRSPGAALGAATGLIDKLDPLKAMQSGMTGDISAAKAEYELSHIQLPIRMIGSTAPALSSVLESSVRLIIYRPITDETALSQYADTVGYACLKSGVVSDFTGYTTGTIDVSGINASSEEQQLIARAFATGVYL